jgi:NAD(P)-dependent dehydrogenase (short-subunit alcohol dehydrogenase family)
MAIDFTGKVALVTGGGSGIGAAVARQLAAGGAKVLVADRNREGAEDVVAAIEAAGGVALAHEVDVADPIEVEAMVDATVRAFGGLNLAVNNAGVGGPSAPTADYPLDGWQTVININLNGVFYGMKYEIAAMMKSGGGAIVNMSSILGSVGFANAPAYVAAKHGVNGLTKTAAVEYAKHGVRINAVGPAFIDTPLLSGIDKDALGYIVGLHPIGRLGTTDEVAALTCFLLSNEASFITGSYHLVDGGYTGL